LLRKTENPSSTLKASGALNARRTGNDLRALIATVSAYTYQQNNGRTRRVLPELLGID